MNVKNINFFERHVEKITLAVAAAGALYLGYMAMQPVTIGDATSPKPINEIKTQLDSAAAALQRAQEATAAKPFGDVAKIKDYSTEYRGLVQGRPIDPALVAQEIPRFAPSHIAPGATTNTPSGQRGDYALLTPKPAAPINVAAEARLLTVFTPPPPLPDGTPAPLPQPGPNGQITLPQSDKRLVILSGEIPVINMLKEMDAASDAKKERIPDDHRKVVIVKIEVERDVVINGKPANKWVSVESSGPNPPAPPANLAGLKWGELPAAWSALEAAFVQILMPEYYLIAPKGEHLVTPIENRLKKLSPSEINARKAQEAELARIRNGVVPTVPTATGGGTGFVDDVGEGTNGGPGMVTPVVNAPADRTALYQQPNIPFWVFDQGVDPNTQYRYRVRVVYANPNYQWTWGLKDPKVQDQEVLFSAWVDVPTPISVPTDVYFFVMGYVGQGPQAKVSTSIYKWTAGNWYIKSITTEPGVSIKADITAGDRTEPVDTNYTVVDVVPVNGSQNDVNVILMDKNGELVTRSSSNDKNNPIKGQIDKGREEARRAVAAVAEEARRAAEEARRAANPTPTVPPGGVPRGPGGRPINPDQAE